MNRIQEAMDAQVRVGGKFFCLHDYVPMYKMEEGHGIGQMKHVHLCRKCGRKELLDEMEPLRGEEGWLLPTLIIGGVVAILVEIGWRFLSSQFIP